jgi:hypothetical protein
MFPYLYVLCSDKTDERNIKSYALYTFAMDAHLHFEHNRYKLLSTFGSLFSLFSCWDRCYDDALTVG